MTIDEHIFAVYNEPIYYTLRRISMSIIPTIDRELRGLIPPLLQEEREQLEQNILADRKCHDPIVLWQGLILDGHNRFEICIKHGIEFQIVNMTFESREEAIVWILDNQLSRRNLSDIARMEMSIKKMEMLREKAQRNLSLAGGDKKSKGSPLPIVSKPEIEAIHVQKEVAADAGVSKGKLYSYMQIKEHGSPALINKVQSGELKVNTAHRLLPKEILKQLTLAGKMLKFIQSVKPPQGYKAADPEIHSKLVNIASLLDTLLSKLGGPEHGNQ